VRRVLLEELDDAARVDPGGLCDRLLAQIEDGRLKLYITSRMLRHRQRLAALYGQGRHLPVRAVGARRSQVVAFARRFDRQALLVAVSRFHKDLPAPVGEGTWGGTTLRLPTPLSGLWRDVLTGATVPTSLTDRAPHLSLGVVFRRLPVAVLERQDA
jgi:(1->4)-alpha-D-glucan 1-alpha-D-glucosylmutase